MNNEKRGFGARLMQALRGAGRGLRRAGRWYAGLYRGKPWWAKLLAGVLSLLAFLAFYIFAVSVNLFWLFGRSPSLDDIMHPRNPQASEMYSADGVLLGKFFKENRSNVPYDSISTAFFDALVSTEDERFYSHHGIDYAGLLAAGKDALRGRARGASTITQQLVKNMFRVRSKYGTGLLGKVPGLGIVIMKSKEMIIATELEMTNSKRDILQMYANTVDFGSNAYGIKTAAKTYFNTSPHNLRTEEAAVLVGMLKAPTAYSPRLNPERSRGRRNVVLENMCAHGKLSRRECDSLKALPIRLDFNVEDAYDGEALYFREAVADYIKEHCPDLDPYTDGLRITTTLDSRMQRYAEEAVRQQMRQVQRAFDEHWRGTGAPWRDEEGREIPGFIDTLAARSDAYKALAARFPDSPDSIRHYLNKPHRVKLFTYDGMQTRTMSTMDSIRHMVSFLHAGFVAMEPQTGYVRAWVGDIDFDSWKYDKVTAMRQPGSTFKLFVYATAMEKGLTPMDRRRDEAISLQVYNEKKGELETWAPHNANGRFSNADLPLRTAFAQSVNTVAVKLGQEVGIANVIATAHDMGVLSPLDDKPALALGASDVNLFEMVNAYATVARNGEYTEPVLVSQILDHDGKVLYEARPKHAEAISARAAFLMQKMLEAGVSDGGGTSHTLQQYLGSYYYNRDIEAGGKTGTTNNHSDAWFIGVTPRLVGGAWVGGEYRSIHFRSGGMGQGSRLALPIFGIFMQKVLADARLRPQYLAHFAPIGENIPESVYGGDFIAVPEAEPDSVEVDSAAVGVDDLMGSDPSEGARDEDPAENAPEQPDRAATQSGEEYYN